MSTTQLSEQQDAEANYFVMCLLMPEDWVRLEVKKIPHFDILNDDHIRALAKTFQVSHGVMAMRLGQLMEK